MQPMIVRRVSCHAALAWFALLLALTADARAVSIDWVPVGNPHNSDEFFPPQPNGYGGVNYVYSIDKFDVTVSQYVEFLNAKDPSGANSLGLYNSNMSNPVDYGGVSFNNLALPGSKYGAIAGDANHPINNVSWYDAIRFANWMNNGQGNGDTETGAYTLLGGTPTPSNGLSITRNAGAKIVLPSEDEWFKAAYYDPRSAALGGPPDGHHYWTYPTTSNTAPTATGPTATPNSANYNDAVLNLTDVGAYSGTTSFYGAFDMGGDVRQWNETLFSGATRGLEGAGFLDVGLRMQASFIASNDPTLENALNGFRLALIIPEPSSVALAALGLLGLFAWGCRRRKSLDRRTRT